jgi:hypothetical protein
MAIIVGLVSVAGSACFAAVCDSPSRSGGPLGISHEAMGHGDISHGLVMVMQAGCDSVLGVSAFAQKALPPNSVTALLVMIVVTAFVAPLLVPRLAIGGLVPVTLRGLAPPGDLDGVRLLI